MAQKAWVEVVKDVFHSIRSTFLVASCLAPFPVTGSGRVGAYQDALEWL